MREDEKELITAIKKSEGDSFMQPPLFEVFVTVLSMGIAVLMFIYPTMLLRNIEPYSLMVIVMPPFYWTIIFFLSALIKGVGLLIDNKKMRIIGLMFSSILYLILSLTFSIDFPRISAIILGSIAVFCLLSIPLVKTTNIKYEED